MNLQVSEAVRASCLLRESATFSLSKRSWSIADSPFKEIIKKLTLSWGFWSIKKKVVRKILVE